MSRLFWSRAAALVLALGLAAWLLAWRLPPRRSRDEYLSLLVAAEGAGKTPRDQAEIAGWSDAELSHAAWAYADQELLVTLAHRLAEARRTGPGLPAFPPP